MTYGCASFNMFECICEGVSCFLWELLAESRTEWRFWTLVADDYKKWNMSAFLRAKVELCGYTAEGLLKDERLAEN